jgi:hypothetical protein
MMKWPHDLSLRQAEHRGKNRWQRKSFISLLGSKREYRNPLFLYPQGSFQSCDSRPRKGSRGMKKIHVQGLDQLPWHLSLWSVTGNQFPITKSIQVLHFPCILQKNVSKQGPRLSRHKGWKVLPINKARHTPTCGMKSHNETRKFRAHLFPI